MVEIAQRTGDGIEQRAEDDGPLRFECRHQLIFRVAPFFGERREMDGHGAIGKVGPIGKRGNAVEHDRPRRVENRLAAVGMQHACREAAPRRQPAQRISKPSRHAR